MNYLKSWIAVISVLAVICFVGATHMMKKGAKEQELLTTETPLEYVTEDGWTVTAYCSCYKCCGKYAENRNGVVTGAEGTKLIAGYSCANNELPFGTNIKIEGYCNVCVQDRTSKWVNQLYDGKIIDIYFDSHEEAINFGKKTNVIVTFTKELING